MSQSARDLPFRLRHMAKDPIVGPLCSALLEEAASAVSETTQFDAVGWWNGKVALFEPNKIPEEGALLFRPRDERDGGS